jgi:hypothetical protein
MFALALSFAPPNLLAGDPAKLIIPLLGLIMAGVFPAVSLTVSSIKSGSFSVQKIGDLADKLREVLRFLELLFVFALASAILIIAAESLDWGQSFWLSFYTSRIFNFVIGFSVGYLILGLPKMRAVFSDILSIGERIAKDEATQKLQDRAAKLAPVGDRFPTKDSFGLLRAVPEDPNGG